MAGVYNRKLFRQASARDELRKIGGIMASSEELMREALMAAMQAPRPSDLGSMPLPPQPAMPMQQPMGMPMMQQPAMPMQQPMDMGMQQPMMPMQQTMMQQQPIQPAIAEPAFMPPQLPQSLQPQGFNDGGPVIIGAGSKFPRVVKDTEAADSSSIDVLGDVDIGQTAGTVVAPPSVNAIGLDALVERVGGKIDTAPPEEVANDIVDTVVEEPTGNLQADLASVYAELTGDPAAYEKNIDALNRGIIGAAIGAGTSARATENISKGLLVGLETARDTEERRVRDSRALQLAQLQAQAEASRKASDDNGSRAYRNPVDAYQDAYQSVMNAGEIDLEIPEGMSREDYADQVAMDLIRRSYSPEQLVGSPFEGMSAPAAEGAGSVGVDQEAVLEEARRAIEGGRDPAGVADKLRQMGIDPGLL
jgi:hypothetical protein